MVAGAIRLAAKKATSSSPCLSRRAGYNMSIAQEEISDGKVHTQIQGTSTTSSRAPQQIPSTAGRASGPRKQSQNPRHRDGVRAGNVWVNCTKFRPPQPPFGDYKQSGHRQRIGRVRRSKLTEVKRKVNKISARRIQLFFSSVTAERSLCLGELRE